MEEKKLGCLFILILFKLNWIEIGLDIFFQICLEMRIWLNRIMKKGKKNWLMKIYEFSGFFFSFSRMLMKMMKKLRGAEDEEKKRKRIYGVPLLP